MTYKYHTSLCYRYKEGTLAYLAAKLTGESDIVHNMFAYNTRAELEQLITRHTNNQPDDWADISICGDNRAVTESQLVKLTFKEARPAPVDSREDFIWWC